jgi:hypothetical protein
MGTRWSKYAGDRIVHAGWRVSLEIPPEYGSYLSTRRYGYVWIDGDVFRGYYEAEEPGSIVDVDVGPFNTLAEAKRTVLEQLKIRYPQSY